MFTISSFECMIAYRYYNKKINIMKNKLLLASLTTILSASIANAVDFNIHYNGPNDFTY